jgi:hypothetical protein
MSSRLRVVLMSFPLISSVVMFSFHVDMFILFLKFKIQNFRIALDPLRYLHPAEAVILTSICPPSSLHSAAQHYGTRSLPDHSHCPSRRPSPLPPPCFAAPGAHSVTCHIVAYCAPRLVVSDPMVIEG